MTSILPEEIMVDILSRLPVMSIKRFRCVCKTWCDLFTSPNFIKVHLNHHSIENDNLTLLVNDGSNLYTIDYDYDSSSSTTTLCDLEAVKIDYPLRLPKELCGEAVEVSEEPLITPESECRVEILGSCNGLICIIIDQDSICIWNPTSKEHKVIGSCCGDYERYPYGFGFGSKIDDYKLVSIVYKFDIGSAVMVYSLETNSWKSLGDIPYLVSAEPDRPAVLVNESLHWILSSYGKSKDFKASQVIISFDINDEIFQEVPQPEQLDDKFRKHLDVLGGCLCILSCLNEICVKFLDVWVMKDYGVRESWTKMFTIGEHTLGECFESLKLIQSFKNGEILLENDYNYYHALVLYDPKHEKAKDLNICGSQDLVWFETESYTRSLVSPKARKLKKKNKMTEAIENMEFKKNKV